MLIAMIARKKDERKKGREVGGMGRRDDSSSLLTCRIIHIFLCAAYRSLFSIFQDAYHCFLCLLADCHTLSRRLSCSGASLPTPQGLRNSARHPEFSRGRFVSITFRERRAIFFQLGDADLP